MVKYTLHIGGLLKQYSENFAFPIQVILELFTLEVCICTQLTYSVVSACLQRNFLLCKKSCFDVNPSACLLCESN